MSLGPETYFNRPNRFKSITFTLEVGLFHCFYVAQILNSVLRVDAVTFLEFKVFVPAFICPIPRLPNFDSVDEEWDTTLIIYKMFQFSLAVVLNSRYGKCV